MHPHNSKIILDYKKLGDKIRAHKELGHKVVCTIGSWDMLHIGHMRYLKRAAEFGDVLVVGTDSDKAIKLYKNPLRPVIPESERMEMLSYQDCINYVTLLSDVDEKGAWKYELIKDIPVDVFIAEEKSYSPKQLKDIKKYCTHLEVLKRQAVTTSTTDIIQNVVKGHLLEMVEKLKK